MESRIPPQYTCGRVKLPKNVVAPKSKSDKIPMSLEEIERVISQGFDEKYDELYEHIRVDITSQAIAVFLFMKNKVYGYKKKRLERELQDIEDMFRVADKGVFGKSFTSAEMLKYLEENFNLNIVERVKKQ